MTTPDWPLKMAEVDEIWDARLVSMYTALTCHREYERLGEVNVEGPRYFAEC